MARSPGFEANDIGYMNEADLILPVIHGGYNHYLPGDHLREWRVNASAWRAWSFGPEFMAQGGDVSGAVTFHNYWNINAGLNVEGEGYSNTALRGGPLLRRPATLAGRFGVNTDSRRTVFVSFNNSWSRAPETDSWGWTTSADVRWRPSGRVNLSVCSIDLEMSALVDLEMSSFGVCSIVVDRTTFSGGGDADIEPQGS
jgi:hypothetical protein